MASSSAPVHPARYLSVFLVLLIGVYLLVFLTGDKRAAPKLGIDLQGGTRVTLTARTPDGSRPEPGGVVAGAADHQRAGQRAGRLRFGGRRRRRQPGHHGARERRQRGPQPRPDRTAVHPAGDPGDSGAEPAAAQARATPARRHAARRRRRRRRPASPAPGGPAAPPPASPRRPASRRRRPRRPPGQPARRNRGPTRRTRRRRRAPRPVPHRPRAPERRRRAGRTGGRAAADQPAPPDPRKDLAERIAEEKKWRQSTRQGVQFLALQFKATRATRRTSWPATTTRPCPW